MEPTYSLLIALFEAWRADIDSEPFAHESYWSNGFWKGKVSIVDIPQQVRGPRVNLSE